MRKIAATLSLTMVFLVLHGQEKPRWMDEYQREQNYPAGVYFTGFTYGEMPQNKSLQDVTQQLKTEAQAELSKKIRLQISSSSQSSMEAVSNNGRYSESETFLNQATTESNTEVVGIKTESHYDEKTRMVYAFAYANKYELTGYYKSNLTLNLTQLEGLLQTAQDLETNGEKSKARQQLEATKPLFAKVRYAQDLLTAIDANTPSDDLQQAKTESLNNQCVQMQARLAQAVYIYVKSYENLFGQNVDIVANKVKAELAVSGCSFVDEAEEADFQLSIRVTTRTSDKLDDFVFCYADTAVELFDNHKQKVVYSDEISEKSGSNSLDKAGRKAMGNAAITIVEKLNNWIR